jgi:colicin import membrane protein
MNRTVIIGAIVVLLAAGGWYQFSYKPEQERIMAEEAAAKAAEAAAAEAAAAEAAAAEAAAAAAAEAEAAAAAAAAAATEAATAATEAVTEGAAAVADAATDAMAALDPANFNADTVVGLIDGSPLDDATKATLKTAVEAARANPALVAETLAQIKTALGM